MKASYNIKRQYRNLHHLIQALGGTKAIQEAGFIKLENPPYEPLSIEVIGEGFLRSKGYKVTCTIAVSHTSVLNGDLMRDPEVTFDYYEEEGIFIPLTYRQDYIGKYSEAIYMNEAGEIRQHTAEHRSLCSFVYTWQINLNQQGFTEAAKQRAKAGKHRTWIEQTATA